MSKQDWMQMEQDEREYVSALPPVRVKAIVGQMGLPKLPSVNADKTGFSYVVAHLREEIQRHMIDYETDPECHMARITEIEAAIHKLQSPNAPAHRPPAAGGKVPPVVGRDLSQGD